jgi:hypothetical protein
LGVGFTPALGAGFGVGFVTTGLRADFCGTAAAKAKGSKGSKSKLARNISQGSPARVGVLRTGQVS